MAVRVAACRVLQGVYRDLGRRPSIPNFKIYGSGLGMFGAAFCFRIIMGLGFRVSEDVRGGLQL